jgi:hypothetical protein
MFGLPALQGGYAPSASARVEIPAEYLRLYQDAGRRYGVDPWVFWPRLARSRPTTAARRLPGCAQA